MVQWKTYTDAQIQMAMVTVLGDDFPEDASAHLDSDHLKILLMNFHTFQAMVG